MKFQVPSSRFLALLTLIFLSLKATASSLPIEKVGKFFIGQQGSPVVVVTNSCGDFTLLFSDGGYTGGGVDGVTNNTHDATGAKVIVATLTSPNGDASSLSFGSVPTNTWVAGVAYTGASGHVNQPYYCLQPTTSNGMYFYALSGNQTSVGFAVHAFSSSGTAYFAGQTGATSASASSIQPGSITVHGTNLYVTALTFTGGSPTGDSNFSSPQDSAGGGQPLQAYAITNTTQNPTWSVGTGTGLAASQMMFGVTNCSGGSSTLLNNLAVYYTLNESGGATRADSTANAQNLTDNNTVGSTNGVSGNAANFTAANSRYLSHADSATLSMTGSFTIAGWIQAKSTSRMGLMEKGGEYDLQINNSRHVEFIVYDSSSGNSDAIESTTTIATGTWYFVVAWYNSADKKAHIKVGAQGGSLSAQGDAAAALTNGPKDGTSNFYLGYQSSASFLDGYWDEFGLWTRVLTGTEINTLYGVTTYPF